LAVALFNQAFRVIPVSDGRLDGSVQIFGFKFRLLQGFFTSEKTIFNALQIFPYFPSLKCHKLSLTHFQQSSMAHGNN
jgi:hypothetical protein